MNQHPNPTADRLHDQLDTCLTELTLRLTGDPSAPSRPGQLALAHDVLDAMLGEWPQEVHPEDLADDYARHDKMINASPGRLAGCAPTGVGKAAGLGLPMFLVAAERAERSLVSTESKSLQSQLIGKDYPLIASIVSDVTGRPAPTFAVHKGFANYACPLTALSSVSDILASLGDEVDVDDSGKTVTVKDLEQLAVTLAGYHSDPQKASLLGLPVAVDNDQLPGEDAVRLGAWVMAEAASGGAGDRAEFPGDSNEKLWKHFSVSTDECPGSSCPLFDLCPAQRARAGVQDADIVVTNHTLLALQASLSIPVVLSNKRIGLFDHLAVDEAHALPGTVRSTGSRQISGVRLLTINKAVTGLLVGDGVSAISGTARTLADHMEATLSGWLVRHAKDPRFDADDHPLAAMVDPIVEWCVHALGALPSSERSGLPARTVLKIARAQAMVNSLLSDLDDMSDPDKSFARWVDVDDRRDTPVTSARFSPVEVADGISANLFRQKMPESEQHRQMREEEDDRSLFDDEVCYAPLSVSMVSATLSPGFTREVGLGVKLFDYESPFDAAYDDSMLFVPRLNTEDELSQVGYKNGYSKWKLDPHRHADWVASVIEEPVRANGGSALVLASTSRSGQLYVDALRAAGLPFTVYSQWDGADPQQVVAQWRNDRDSVLVGTRSMMTGVDAAGDTCSLVIIDRVPRNPSNVVDDARAELLREGAGMDKWAADRAVYVSDAALLLEQAAGRLIRRLTDSGMVMCLDPRLMKGTPISQQEQMRSAYMSAFRRFRRRTGDIDKAIDFLLAQRERRTGADEAVA